MGYGVRVVDDTFTIVVEEGDLPLEEALRLFDSLAADFTCFSVLSDMSMAGSLDAMERAAVKKWATDNQKTFNEKVDKWAFVVNGRLQQGVLTAIKWFTEAEYAERVFVDREMAEEWLQESPRDALPTVDANARGTLAVQQARVLTGRLKSRK